MVNLLLTVTIMAVMIGGWVDPVVMFMIGVVLALTINYPNVVEQRRRIDAHSKAALLMAGILLAAGAFTGIMTGIRHAQGDGDGGGFGSPARAWAIRFRSCSGCSRCH